jgi:uncharacterized 2Fe-2S/4Fe-4S cluster protein (DUF4445 family)
LEPKWKELISVSYAVCVKSAATVMNKTFLIDFEPLGRRGDAIPGQTILDAALSAGVGLASVCGGGGTCEGCRIRLASGLLTTPSQVELDVLNGKDLIAGIRLACQAEPLSDCKVEIPPESMTSVQRLQVEGLETHTKIKPLVGTPGAYGLAVDVGTTKLAAYLIRLETGETVTKTGAMNPQIAYGEDVISRIAYSGREPGGARTLQKALVETLNTLIVEMCTEAHVPQNSILDAVLVGNTTMHHLLAGLPVEQLGRAPFPPATTRSLTIPASDLELNLGPGAMVHLPPVIAGYVGSDHIAMLMATDIWKSPRNILAMDIGTNTEISLVSKGKIICCSCASGPAFEGAHIREGMRAAPGAIERVRWSEGKFLWQSIGNLPPVGICGSGILDVVAALQDGRIIKPTGVFSTGYGSEIVLVTAAATGLDRDLVVTRKDIHEIQLAKSAIRVGVEILLQNAALKTSDLDEFIVAGAFGTYLDLRSAVRTGMFPPLPIERFRQVGNAAGMGAKQMLVSVDKRREAERFARKISYVELTSQVAFTKLFLEQLNLEV